MTAAAQNFGPFTLADVHHLLLSARLEREIAQVLVNDGRHEQALRCALAAAERCDLAGRVVEALLDAMSVRDSSKESGTAIADEDMDLADEAALPLPDEVIHSDAPVSDETKRAGSPEAVPSERVVVDDQRVVRCVGGPWDGWQWVLSTDTTRIWLAWARGEKPHLGFQATGAMEIPSVPVGCDVEGFYESRGNPDRFAWNAMGDSAFKTSTLIH